MDSQSLSLFVAGSILPSFVVALLTTYVVRRNAALALRSVGSAGELLLGRALREADEFARDIARQTLDLPESMLPA